MKNKIYVKCLVENEPYTFDFETEQRINSIDTLKIACVDVIIDNQVDSLTKDKIVIVWSNLITKNIKSTINHNFNIQFRNEYIESIQNKRILELKAELAQTKIINEIEIILNDIIKLKEKLFNQFLKKHNFNHEGY
jgi:hypothetical protein